MYICSSQDLLDTYLHARKLDLLWYRVPRLPPTFYTESPLCRCGVHTVWSRNRLTMLNDLDRNQTYLRALTKVRSNGWDGVTNYICIRKGNIVRYMVIFLIFQVLAGRSTVLCISDGSLLPILIAKAGIASVNQVPITECFVLVGTHFRETKFVYGSEKDVSLMCSLCQSECVPLWSRTARNWNWHSRIGWNNLKVFWNCIRSVPFNCVNPRIQVFSVECSSHFSRVMKEVGTK